MPRPKCFIAGCERPNCARQMCTLHYWRWRHNGDPFTLRRAPDGAGTVSSEGYLVITVGDRRIKEHRHVMQVFLGRELERTELVHHIDGDKLNNTLENLLLVSRPDHLRDHHASFRNGTHKECTACHEIKPRGEFNRKPSPGGRGDPHASKCRACMVSVQRRQYLKRKAAKSK